MGKRVEPRMGLGFCRRSRNCFSQTRTRLPTQNSQYPEGTQDSLANSKSEFSEGDNDSDLDIMETPDEARPPPPTEFGIICEYGFRAFNIKGHILIEAPAMQESTSTGWLINKMRVHAIEQRAYLYRTSRIEFHVDGRGWTLDSTHLPHEGHGDEAFLDCLIDAVINKTEPNISHILCMDANTAVGRLTRAQMDGRTERVLGIFCHGNRDERAAHFLGCMRNQKFALTNTFTDHPEEDRITHIPANTANRRIMIDYIAAYWATMETIFMTSWTKYALQNTSNSQPTTDVSRQSSASQRKNLCRTSKNIQKLEAQEHGQVQRARHAGHATGRRHSRRNNM